MAAALPLDDQLCFSLYATSMAVSRAYKPMLDRLGFTYPQYLVLHALWEQDDRSIRAIADRLALEPSTVTPLATRLSSAGQVERRQHPDDGRQVQVWLTAGGADLREQCGCLTEGLLAATGMTAHQVASLNHQVMQLRAALRSSK